MSIPPMDSNPEEVTDEASKAEILAPGHAVFQSPNRITLPEGVPGAFLLFANLLALVQN